MFAALIVETYIRQLFCFFVCFQNFAGVRCKYSHANQVCEIRVVNEHGRPFCLADGRYEKMPINF